MVEGDMRKDFGKSWLDWFVPTFIVVVFVLILCILGFYGWLAYKGISAIGEMDASGGVKPIIERMWCGSPGCLSK